MTEAAAIVVNDVSKTYRSARGAITALDHVSIDIAAGEVACIVGRAGSGKTTLLFAIGGLERPDTGTITVAGREIGSLDRQARCAYRRDLVGWLLEDPALLPQLTAAENVALPLRMLHVPEAVAHERAERALADVGLPAHAARFPRELSGGEQQRVGLARALAKRPALLLADEPTSRLDSENARVVGRLLRESAEAWGTTVVIATHDRELATIGRAIEIDSGRVIQSGAK